MSNNSAPAIEAYLSLQGLTKYVALVIGRAHGEPLRMKPDPHSVHAAVNQLHAEPSTCVLVGDSVTDVAAAVAAGVPVIGYANKPGKTERLERAGAEVLIESMAILSRELLSQASGRP